MCDVCCFFSDVVILFDLKRGDDGYFMEMFLPLVERESMVRTMEIHTADFCICHATATSAARTSARAYLVAVLRGATLISPGVIGAESQPLVLRYKLALAKKRALYTSTAFKRADKTLAVLIHQCFAAFPMRKCEFRFDEAKFVQSNVDRRFVVHVAFLASSKVPQAEYTKVLALSGAGFLAHVKEIHAETCYFGASSHFGTRSMLRP